MCEEARVGLKMRNAASSGMWAGVQRGRWKVRRHLLFGILTQRAMGSQAVCPLHALPLAGAAF